MILNYSQFSAWGLGMDLVRAAWCRREFTYEVMAQKVGLHKSLVYRHIRGKAWPNEKQIEAYLKALEEIREAKAA